MKNLKLTFSEQSLIVSFKLDLKLTIKKSIQQKGVYCLEQ
jgi:hypothetical protein